MILIIGASSFIGVYAADEFLNNGIKVCVTGRNDKFRDYYENKGIQYFNLDITNKKDFDNLSTDNIEGVILLAGLLPANTIIDKNEENADQYFIVNTIGTINVLEFCRKNKINRVISTASYADVINLWSRDRAITEADPRDYIYTGDHAIYVFSKNAANDVLEYYNQQYGMKNAIFRFPIVYGVGPHGYFSVDGQKKKSGFQKFFDNALIGDIISIYGDSTIIRDVVYVKDVVNAFYKAIFNNNTYGLYNITSGKGITLKEQAEIMAEVFKDKKKSKVVLEPKKENRSKSFLFSIDKAKNDFGYDPIYKDFRKMMRDYKKDYENDKYENLFHYK